MNPIIALLPDHKTRLAPNYLYAFEFRNGRVKIGVTWNPKARAKTLAGVFRQQILRAHLAPFHGAYRGQAERSALASARRIGNVSAINTELFDGLKFGEASNLISQMARREYTFSMPPSWTPAVRRAKRIAAAAAPEAA